MSAKSRMQFLGNIQIILVLVIVTAGGFLLDRILGGLFAALIFLGTIFWAAQYMFLMYDLDSRLDAFGALLTFMFGVNLPNMIIGEGHIIKKSSSNISKLGGPGVCVVKNDSAAVTELGSRPRVLGPGVHLITNNHETVKEVVDLRPQVRSGTVTAMTKDGFDVELTFIVGFQIDPGGRQPTVEEPYPFSEEAVLKAVYRSKQVAKDGAQLWHERVPGAVFGNVREMIATHHLEDFFDPDNVGSNPRADLKEWLYDSCEGAAANFGAQLNWVSFTTPKIPDETAQKYVEYYGAKLQRKIKETEAQAQQQAFEILFKAFDQLSAGDKLDRLVRIRFIEALEAISKDKTSTLVLPYDAIKELRPSYPEESGS